MNLPSKSIRKHKILSLAANEKGIRIHPNDWSQDELHGRLRIYRILGLVSVKKEGNHLCYRLTKDTHLL